MPRIPSFLLPKASKRAARAAAGNEGSLRASRSIEGFRGAGRPTVRGGGLRLERLGARVGRELADELAFLLVVVHAVVLEAPLLGGAGREAVSPPLLLAEHAEAHACDGQVD